MTATRPISIRVTTMSNAIAEYDRNTGKLRISTPYDATLAVFSRGGVYRLTPDVDPGYVTIANSDLLPDLAPMLERQGVIRVENTVYDHVTASTVVIAEVLI